MIFCGKHISHIIHKYYKKYTWIFYILPIFFAFLSYIIVFENQLLWRAMYFHTIHFREHKTYMKQIILCRAFYVKIAFVSLFMFGCVLTHIPLCTWNEVKYVIFFATLSPKCHRRNKKLSVKCNKCLHIFFVYNLEFNV